VAALPQVPVSAPALAASRAPTSGVPQASLNTALRGALENIRQVRAAQGLPTSTPIAPLAMPIAPPPGRVPSPVAVSAPSPPAATPSPAPVVQPPAVAAPVGSAVDRESVPSDVELRILKDFLREAGLTEEELEGDRSELKGCLKAVIRHWRRR